MTAPASTPASGFRQQLGLFDATMLVAGSMIGSGIFIVSSDIARDVGSSGWLLFIWALAGVMTIIGALSYAELAAMMPNAGGQYVYLREAYSPLWGFLYGWTCFAVIQTGFIAAVSVAFAKYLGVLVPALGTGKEAVLWQVENLDWVVKLPVPWMDEPMVFFKREHFTIRAGQLVAVGVVFVLTVINLRGVRHGKLVQNIFTVAKLLGIGMLIVLGLTVARDPAAVAYNQAHVWDGITETESFHTVSKFMPMTVLAIVMVLSGAMVGSLFSADAWNNVTFIAAEIHEPRRNLPRSLWMGTALVITLYMLANLAYLAALPVNGTKDGPTAFDRGIAHAKDDRVATAVLEGVSPNMAVPIMAVAIMISAFGCTNGILLSGGRLYYAMAQDGLFFRSVGTLSSRGVPAVGLILQSLWSLVLIFTGSYSELLDYIVFAALFFYVLTVGGLFVLRRKRPDLPRPYRAFGYPLVPALYMALAAVIMVSLLFVKPVFSWPSFLIVLTGIPVYFLWRGHER